MKKILLTAGITLSVVATLAWMIYISNTNTASHTTSTASWISKATSVDELMQESNLVVRVRVTKEPVSRVVREDLPLIEFRNGTPVTVGSRTNEAIFSDTQFEILKVYVGKAPSVLTVMQTGGVQPDNSQNVTEMADDPLYRIGEEYILFLIDISGDKVQAPNGILYRIVNPAGRYIVLGDAVQSYTDATTDQQGNAANIPKTVSEIESQIAKSMTK